MKIKEINSLENKLKDKNYKITKDESIIRKNNDELEKLNSYAHKLEEEIKVKINDFNELDK